jgi:oxaloacetate decarboxylase alpha subunit
MPRLVDTTLRLLGQEPLAGTMPTADLLRLAEILDRAGFAYLEVSGGGCFASAVKGGVESPWERIRALKARTETPLGMALRGRFLVGSRPASVDFVRRFVASAAHSGIDVFRLHDPLNDVSNLSEAAEAITAAGREFDAGLLYNPGHPEQAPLADKARQLADLGAARILVHDPSGALHPQGSAELVDAVRDSSGLPVGLYCQGAGGSGLAAGIEAVRAGADLLATAVYPLALTLHRVSGEGAAQGLSGLGYETGIDVGALWRAGELIDEHIADEPVSPIPPRVSTRAAQHRLPAGLVAALDVHLRANGAGDRIDEVIEEFARIRSEAGWPPVAAPIGQILASQALIHVLSASRYQTVVDELQALLAGRFGTPPAPIDGNVLRAVQLVSGDEPEPVPELDIDEVRNRADGLASSEEELLLLALFGEEAEPLLQTIRGRGRRDEGGGTAGLEPGRAERVREIVRVVQESGVDEVTIEDEGMRITVRRHDERQSAPAAPEAEVVEAAPSTAPVPPPVDDGLIRIEAPMVGTFYRAAEPGAPPFVSEGDLVVSGQTLCILEAMKLMNEIKAEDEGIIRSIRAENAQPVEYGQLLFELEPVDGLPPVL